MMNFEEQQRYNKLKRNYGKRFENDADTESVIAELKQNYTITASDEDMLRSIGQEIKKECELSAAFLKGFLG